MKLYKGKSLVVVACTGLALSLFFQNCSKVAISDIATPQPASTAAATGVPVDSSGTGTPTEPQPIGATPPAAVQPFIEITASASTVVEGQQGVLTVRLHEIEIAKYRCVNRLTQEVAVSGEITQPLQEFRVVVNHDLICEVTGIAKNSGTVITATQNLALDCASRIKNPTNNKCQDFKCEKVIQLATLNDLLKVEARDSRGLCYAYKLVSGLSRGASTLTKEIDQEVTSRSHDGGSVNRHPYNMGSVKTEFRLEGDRVVKLSGGLSETAPILVDNFVLIGVHPADQDVSADLNSAYTALGTSDSTVIDPSRGDTGSIEFNSIFIPLKKYGSGGTSSLSAVDITRAAKSKIIHSLDFRALDCGGARELSDIYLLFQ